MTQTCRWLKKPPAAVAFRRWTCLAYQADAGGVQLAHAQLVPVDAAEPPEARRLEGRCIKCAEGRKQKLRQQCSPVVSDVFDSIFGVS